MGNIDSRVSPLCVLQTTIISGTVQSNSALVYISLKQLTLVAAGAIYSRVRGLSVVSLQVQQCLEIKRFSSGWTASGHLSGRTHTCAHVHTDNYNLSIMIYKRKISIDITFVGLTSACSNKVQVISIIELLAIYSRGRFSGIAIC